QRLFRKQYHCEKGRRRLSRHSVWRLRRRNSQLPADHEGLELHGAALSPAGRNPRWHMEIPRGAACELSPASVRLVTDSPLSSRRRTTKRKERPIASIGDSRRTPSHLRRLTALRRGSGPPGMAEMLDFRRRDGEEVASEFRSALPFHPLVKTHSP